MEKEVKYIFVVYFTTNIKTSIDLKLAILIIT